MDFCKWHWSISTVYLRHLVLKVKVQSVLYELCQVL